MLSRTDLNSIFKLNKTIKLELTAQSVALLPPAGLNATLQLESEMAFLHCCRFLSLHYLTFVFFGCSCLFGVKLSYLVKIKTKRSETLAPFTPEMFCLNFLLFLVKMLNHIIFSKRINIFVSCKYKKYETIFTKKCFISWKITKVVSKVWPGGYLWPLECF